MPVRSAILGAVLAVIVIVATVVFGSSLNSLVSHPSLYGWNWDDALIAGGGVGDVPAAQSASLLDHDPQVAAWSGYWFGTLQLDGHAVPVIGGTPKEAVGPPVLTGHGFDAADQIVLGPGTLAQLHKTRGGHGHRPLRDDRAAFPPDRRDGHHAGRGDRRGDRPSVHGDGRGGALPAHPRVRAEPVRPSPRRGPTPSSCASSPG